MTFSIGRAALLLSWAVAWAANDPTQPATLPPGSPQSAGVPAAQSGAPQLQSILYSRQRKLALISGQTLRQGEQLGEAVVTAILPDRVILQDSEQQQVLYLTGEVRKQVLPPPRRGKKTP